MMSSDFTQRERAYLEFLFRFRHTKIVDRLVTLAHMRWVCQEANDAIAVDIDLYNHTMIDNLTDSGLPLLDIG